MQPRSLCRLHGKNGTAMKFAALRIARRHLLRLPFDVAGGNPDMDAVRGFARILTPEVDFSALWDAIRGVRTFQEEVRLFRQAGPGPLKATASSIGHPSRIGAIWLCSPLRPGRKSSSWINIPTCVRAAATSAFPPVRPPRSKPMVSPAPAIAAVPS